MLAESRPNFLIIGAAKAATTALSDLLARHPQAGIVRGKEPHFFAMDPVYARGWAWYQSLYAHCRDKQAVGDASTSNSRIRYFPKAIARIRAHVPDVKIIYMVRHPLERMVSAYVERLGSPGAANVFGSINDAVQRQPMIIDSSRYWEVFDCYRQHFGEAQIHIVWFEEFVARTQHVFDEVCRFLEIEDMQGVEPSGSRRNSRGEVLDRVRGMGRGDIEVRAEWDPAVRQWVSDQIAEDNLRFLEYFQRPADYWGPIFS